MNRQRFLDLAEQGLRMPIGTDLILREKLEVSKIFLSGQKLAAVLLEAADRYHTPLVMPVMDLMLEKALLLSMIGVKEAPEQFHFKTAPTADVVARFEASMNKPLPARMRACVAAIKHVRRAGPRYIPMGMSIGPVSLMTRLMADPMTPIYMAGCGLTAEKEPDIQMAETLLEMATQVVLRSVRVQLEAGATTIFIAEPSANRAYFSPKQMEEGSDLWERFVIRTNRRVAALIEGHGANLMFHCCGELTEAMLRSFNVLNPAILSLGASRDLAEDAALVPGTTVLYGNLPTKKFFSDQAITTDQVAAMTKDLVCKMRHVHHPFILGSECNVLSVKGYHETIVRKLRVMLTCAAEAAPALVA